jgi:hypothetical protein
LLCDANLNGEKISVREAWSIPAKPKQSGISPNFHKLKEVFMQRSHWFRVQRCRSQESLTFVADLHRTYVSAIARCMWNVSSSNMERNVRARDL